jgi:aryl-alcohol dehydrogenase-like predicted oxidoreductase
MQFIIGTAQFSGKYGLNPLKKKTIKVSYLNKVYYFAKKNKINILDTAQSYEGVEKIIGKSKLSNLNIITKFQIKKNSTINSLYLDLKKSLKNLNKKKIYALLLHNPWNITKKEINILKIFFKKIKKDKLVKKIGISIYYKKDLYKIYKYLELDIVQLPLNILNRRLYNDKTIDFLKKKKIEIHVRSVFLKGLLTSNKKCTQFSKWKKLFVMWEKITLKKIYLKIYYAIKFIQNLSGLTNFIIGFDNLYQFKLIMKSLKKKNELPYELKNFFSKDNKLTDPRKWKEI